MSTYGSGLSKAINTHVRKLRANGRVASDEKTSWLVFDLSADRSLAAINATASRQCASMVKPLVALAFLHQADRGKLVYGPVSRTRCEAMIQKSSNTSTDWVMSKAGGPSGVQRILSKHYGTLLPHTHIVEYIGASGRTYRNRASASDYGRFLRALWRDQLPHSTELKRLMNLPSRNRIYTGAPAIPSGTKVYNKTGSTSRLCGDMGILVARRTSAKAFPYIIVGIIEKTSRASNYGSWIGARSKVIRGVSNLVYTELKKSHQLT